MATAKEKIVDIDTLNYSRDEQGSFIQWASPGGAAVLTLDALNQEFILLQRPLLRNDQG